MYDGSAILLLDLSFYTSGLLIVTIAFSVPASLLPISGILSEMEFGLGGKE